MALSPTPTTGAHAPDPNATQRGINSRIVNLAALAIKLQAKYFDNPKDKSIKAEYVRVSEELRRLRSVPMQSLAGAPEKRFVELEV